DITRPADTGPVLKLTVELGHGNKALGRVRTPLDPVGATGQSQVAVAVHQARDNGSPPRVDHLTSRRALALLAGWPDPADPAVLRQQADTNLQPGGSAIGQRGVTVHGAGHSVTLGQRSRPRGPDRKPGCPAWRSPGASWPTHCGGRESNPHGQLEDCWHIG